jgi:hypothetical protein
MTETNQALSVSIEACANVKLLTSSWRRTGWVLCPSTRQHPKTGLVSHSPCQLKAAHAVFQTALSSDGYTWNGSIQKADDELAKVSTSRNFGALKDYRLAV